MKEFRIQSLFFSLVILFTLSTFTCILTEIYTIESFGYSLLLITLPLGYQKELGINTRVFLTDLCQVDEQNCSIFVFLAQVVYLAVFVFFCGSLLMFKASAVYSGVVYVFFGLFSVVYALVVSQDFKFGAILCFFHLALAAVLIFLTFRKTRIEKRILKYDVVQQQGSDLARVGNESVRSYERQANESQLDLNDMQGKIEIWRGKYKEMKLKYCDSQTIIEKLENNLKEKEKIIDKREKRIRKADTRSNPDIELERRSCGA